MIKDKEKIAIVGLGYVGLPLAIEFARHFEVIGFDLNTKRIDELTKGFDRTNEVDSKDLNNSSKLLYTSDSKNFLKQKYTLLLFQPQLTNLMSLTWSH